MTSIARMSRMLKQLLEHDSVELARAAGLRQRKLTFVQLAFILVLGWWKQPRGWTAVLPRAPPPGCWRSCGGLWSLWCVPTLSACRSCSNFARCSSKMAAASVCPACCKASGAAAEAERPKQAKTPRRRRPSKSRCAGICWQVACTDPTYKRDASMSSTVSCASR